MAKKPDTATFHSNYTEYRLVRQAHVETPLAIGAGWVTSIKPIRYQFQSGLEDGKLVGVLTVPVGSDKLIDHSGWLAPTAEQGVERDAADALRAHHDFGRNIWEASVPAASIRARIQRAIATLAEADLDAILAEERAKGNRRELVVEIESAIRLVVDTRAEYEAEALRAAEAEAAEAEAQAAKPAAKKAAKQPATV